MKTPSMLVAVVAAFAVCSSPALADKPGRHAAYVSALSKLRQAVRMLREPNERQGRPMFRDSLRSVQAALDATREAAIEVGKDVDQRVSVSHDGRTRRGVARQLLINADRDLNQREDDYRARRYRDEARNAIADALGAFRR